MSAKNPIQRTNLIALLLIWLGSLSLLFVALFWLLLQPKLKAIVTAMPAGDPCHSIVQGLNGAVYGCFGGFGMILIGSGLAIRQILRGARLER